VSELRAERGREDKRGVSIGRYDLQVSEASHFWREKVSTCLSGSVLLMVKCVLNTITAQLLSD